MHHLPDLRLVGGHVLIGDTLAEVPLTLADGRIVDGPGRSVDCRGYWVLPGIVDLHGDGFEHHLRPRPTAPFPVAQALVSVDAELAVNGITTAWLAQSWSWEGGARGGHEAEALIAALAAARPRLLADVHVQIRYETHLLDDHDRLLSAVRRHGVGYVVFNDHLSEALLLAEHRPDRFAAWAGSNGHSLEGLLATVRAAAARAPDVPEALSRLARALMAEGVRLGSHDDASSQTRAFFRGLGADICEFPTTLAAAQAARAAGEPVLMGAPNVVRGGSQAGNIAAMALIEGGLCDALVSDYHYPSLVQAVWRIADQRAASFGCAWRLISSGPAAIMGLQDRGWLGPSARADLVLMNSATRRVEGCVTSGRISHLSSGLAARLVGAGLATALSGA
ncbi:MAG: alpha-D-ribose 1-methylphosphonate 5-triphosphate diphosphatase [Alkalilacustris sp.]